METESMLFAIECALADDIDEGNTDQAVEVIFDGVVKTLQRDTRFPRLTRTDYDLLLADVTKEAREALLPYRKFDTESAAEIICDAVVDEIAEARKRRKLETSSRHRAARESSKVAPNNGGPHGQA